MQTNAGDDAYRRIFEAVGDSLILNDIHSGLVVAANPAACALHGYDCAEFVGLHPAAYLHPQSYPHFAEWVRQVQMGDAVSTTARHVRRDGTPFIVDLRGTACTFEQRQCLLSTIRDVSERVRAERLLRQQVEAHTREQATLLEISQTLASALELQPGLILDQLRVIIDYTHAALFALEELTLVGLAVRGQQRLVEAMPFHIQLDGPETLAALLNGHRPRRIADVWSGDPAAHFIRSLLDADSAVLLEGVQAWMWVPLAVEGRVIGAVVVAHAEPDRFTAHDADLALTVANQAAITLVNAQLYAQAQALAAVQERQRLAQNLHDAVNQSLFSAGLIAEVLPRLWEQDPDEGRRSLQDLRRLTRGALAEMRGLLAELRPQVIIDSELGDLLRQLSTAFTGRTNIPVSATVVGTGTLPVDVQVAFYRLCQEAFINIAKHAQASEVTIHLLYADGAVELRIRDDGQGFEPDQVPSGHYGLAMMRERADAAGVQLSVTSRPGDGTEIAIRWMESSEAEAL